MVATVDDAKRDFGPIRERLTRCVSGAIDDYLAEMGPFAYRQSLRSRASLLHDYMIDRIMREFEAEPGITFKLANNLFTVSFWGRWVVKLKKHDKRLRTSNIPTQLVLDWNDQVQLALPGMPEPVTNLHVGYQPGEVLSQSPVWMTCPEGRLLAWAWRLDDAASAAGPTPMPTAPPAPTAPRKPRARPKFGQPAIRGDIVR